MMIGCRVTDAGTTLFSSDRHNALAPTGRQAWEVAPDDLPLTLVLDPLLQPLLDNQIEIDTIRIRGRCDIVRSDCDQGRYFSVLMSADSPCAISMSVLLLTVQAVRSVTASMTSRAWGAPWPDALTPPNGSCTSAPIQGRFA